MRYSEEEKEMWLADWRQSGKSAWAYAKANGLTLATFLKWTKAENQEISEEQSKPCFIEVPMHALPPPKSMQEILIEKGDVRIHIPLCAGAEELRAVMEGLGKVRTLWGTL